MTENQSRAEKMLEQIKKLRKIIKDKNDKIEALRLGCIPGAVTYDKDKVQTSPRNYQEEALADAADLEKEIFEHEAEIDDVKLTCYGYIKRIPEIEQQNVLIYYYIDECYWEDVASKMNYSRARIFDIRDNALESFGAVVNIGLN